MRKLVILATLFLPGLTPARDPLQRHRPVFHFSDRTAEAGLGKPTYGAFVHAVAWGDYDNDGRLDVYLGTFGERSSAAQYGHARAPVNMLLRQTGAGTFEKVAMPELEVRARCSGAVFVDFDNDGDVDLYASSNRWEMPSDNENKKVAQEQICRLFRNDGGKFVDISLMCGACPSSLFRCRDVGIFDFDNDGLLDILVLQDTVVRKDGQVYGSRLFRNQGNLHFVDVTAKAGLPEDLWGFGIAVADLNRDGLPDFYLCGSNQLYLSKFRGTYRHATELQPVFDHHGKELDFITGATFGDLDHDGDFDLITGPHHYHGPSRVHVFLNEGMREGVPRFREVTREIGVPAMPIMAPHMEIQDFDNDGLPDLYWSVFYAEGKKRWPFICKGQGIKDGLPRFDVPVLPKFRPEALKKNIPAAEGVSAVYYVGGPAVDYDQDGNLDLFCINWPPEMCKLYRNETRGGNWLQVRVQGTKMNRMGIGAQVKLYPVGDRSRLLGFQEITLNGGYSSARPPIAHFGLGKVTSCDVEVILPSRQEPIFQKKVSVNQVLQILER